MGRPGGGGGGEARRPALTSWSGDTPCACSAFGPLLCWRLAMINVILGSAAE